MRLAIPCIAKRRKNKRKNKARNISRRWERSAAKVAVNGVASLSSKLILRGRIDVRDVEAEAS